MNDPRSEVLLPASRPLAPLSAAPHLSLPAPPPHRKRSALSSLLRRHPPPPPSHPAPLPSLHPHTPHLLLLQATEEMTREFFDVVQSRTKGKETKLSDSAIYNELVKRQGFSRVSKMLTQVRPLSPLLCPPPPAPQQSRTSSDQMETSSATHTLALLSAPFRTHTLARDRRQSTPFTNALTGS